MEDIFLECSISDPHCVAGVAMDQMQRMVLQELNRRADNLSTSLNSFCRMNTNSDGFLSRGKFEQYLKRVELEFDKEDIDDFFFLCNKVRASVESWWFLIALQFEHQGGIPVDEVKEMLLKREKARLEEHLK